jgi:AraC-like DNA-binding protein
LTVFDPQYSQAKPVFIAVGASRKKTRSMTQHVSPAGYRLLIAPDYLTHADIAQAVGYSHACNFSTTFKAHFRYIPRIARRTNL